LCTDSGNNGRMAITPLIERIRSIDWWRVPWRPALAYLVASYCAGLVFYGIVFVARDMERGLAMRIVTFLVVSLELGPIFALFACIPATLSLLIIRLAKLPRGVSEFIAGGLCAILNSSLFVNPASGDPPGLLSLGFWEEVGPFAIAGTVAGLVYWLANGRPRSGRQRAAKPDLKIPPRR